MASAGENWVQTHWEPGGCPRPLLCNLSTSSSPFHLIVQNKMSHILLGLGRSWMKKNGTNVFCCKKMVGSQSCLNFRFGNDSLMKGQSGQKLLKASSKQLYWAPTKWKMNLAFVAMPISQKTQESLERCQEEDFPVSDIFHHWQGCKKNCAIGRSITWAPLNQEIWPSPRLTPKFCTIALHNTTPLCQLRFNLSTRLLKSFDPLQANARRGKKFEGDWHQKHMCASWSSNICVWGTTQTCFFPLDTEKLNMIA